MFFFARIMVDRTSLIARTLLRWLRCVVVALASRRIDRGAVLAVPATTQRNSLTSPVAATEPPNHTRTRRRRRLKIQDWITTDQHRCVWTINSCVSFFQLYNNNIYFHSLVGNQRGVRLSPSNLVPKRNRKLLQCTLWTIKSWQNIRDHNSGKPWWIFIIFALL